MKKIWAVALSLFLLFATVGCNKSGTGDKDNSTTNQMEISQSSSSTNQGTSDSAANQITAETIRLETIKKDICFSGDIPENLCYNGYIIYVSKDGRGSIYTSDGKEILPVGDYTISPLLNSYVNVYGNTTIDNIYPIGIYNVKTHKWLFEPRVDLNNGTIYTQKHNGYLKVVIGGAEEYYNEDGEKVDYSIVENTSTPQETSDYLKADWEADPSNKNCFAVVNEKYGKMTEYVFRNVTSFDGGFYSGIAFYTDEIKPGVDRKGIISSLGDILVEPKYSNIYVSNNYVLGVSPDTADLYEIKYN